MDMEQETMIGEKAKPANPPLFYIWKCKGQRRKADRSTPV